MLDVQQESALAADSKAVEYQQKDLTSKNVAAILFDGVQFSPVEVQPSQYPEAILQLTDHGNKYYGSFQSYSKQFISDDSHGMVRWPNSAIESTQRAIINAWSGSDDTMKQKIQDTHGNTNGNSLSKSLGKANKLFKWSSGEAYIEARKQELQRRKGAVQATVDDMEKLNIVAPPVPPAKQAIKIALPKESVINNLNRAIETESNKFIHTRIQKIKHHHSEAIKKQIHERKRHDHELHLKRLKMKEEEYERELVASLASQQKQPGFLGSLFGFSFSTSQQSELGSQQTVSTTSIDSTPQTESGNGSGIGNGTTSSLKSKRFSLLLGNNLFAKLSTTDVSKRPNGTLISKRDKPTVVSTPGSMSPSRSADMDDGDKMIDEDKNEQSPPTKIENEPKLSIEHEKNSNVDQNTDHHDQNHHNDHDDEFAEFISSAPQLSPPESIDKSMNTTFFDISALPAKHLEETVKQDPARGHKFIPFRPSTPGDTNNNMTELLDIFTSPTKPNPPKINKLIPENDNLLDI
jgi:hypothetical protein